jgi:hypothetical protein
MLQVLKIVLFTMEIEGRKVNLMIIEEKTKYVKMSSQQARIYLQNLIVGDGGFTRVGLFVNSVNKTCTFTPKS